MQNANDNINAQVACAFLFECPLMKLDDLHECNRIFSVFLNR